MANVWNYTVTVNGGNFTVQSSKSGKDVALDVLSQLYGKPRNMFDIKRLTKAQLNTVNPNMCCTVSYQVCCGGGKFKTNTSVYMYAEKVVTNVPRACCIQPYGKINYGKRR